MISASIKENRKDNCGRPCVDVEIETWQLKHFRTLEEAHAYKDRLMRVEKVNWLDQMMEEINDRTKR